MATSHERGFRSEEIIGEMLAVLCKEGHFAHFERTDRHSASDNLGIDFWIYFDDIPRMPLQVKSGEAGKKRFCARHTDIPCVIPRGNLRKNICRYLRIHKQKPGRYNSGYSLGS